MKNLEINPKTIEQVLRCHAARYPLMRCGDAVKVLYQNEFGGGHLIEDPSHSLAWLRCEYAATPRDPEIPLTVPLGNGIVRVQLAALDIAEMPLARLNDLFVESAKQIHGDIKSFQSKLRALVQLAREPLFTFSARELEGFLHDYAHRGYPPVHHSPQFRAAYCPSYRVVLEKLLG